MYWLISPYAQTGSTKPFFSQLNSPMRFPFFCISRIMLRWQVEGSSSYQDEWLFLEALKVPSGFRRSPSTVLMKRGFYCHFQHWEKTRCSLRNAQWKGLRWLRKNTGQVLFNNTETLLDGCCAWCHALLVLAVCRSSRITGRQDHRHRIGSEWQHGHNAQKDYISYLSNTPFLFYL